MSEKKDKKSQQKTGPSNTKLAPKKVVESRMYTFTWNNYDKSHIKELETYFKSRKNLLYVFQEETGENGTKHLQGCFKSNSPIPFETLKNKFNTVHWEFCKNWNASVAYCSKDDTRTGDIYNNMGIEILVSGFDYSLMKPWQKLLFDLMDEKPHDRRIIWLWSKNGDKGKTRTIRELCRLYKNKILFVNGKGDNIKCGVARFLAIKGNVLKMAIFGYPRSKEDYISYDAIEEIKDGLFFSGKYESGMILINTPHVVILCNFPPDKSKLSKDRWHIINIDDDDAGDRPTAETPTAAGVPDPIVNNDINVYDYNKDDGDYEVEFD